MDDGQAQGAEEVFIEDVLADGEGDVDRCAIEVREFTMCDGGADGAGEGEEHGTMIKEEAGRGKLRLGAAAQRGEIAKQGFGSRNIRSKIVFIAQYEQNIFAFHEVAQRLLY